MDLVGDTRLDTPVTESEPLWKQSSKASDVLAMHVPILAAPVSVTRQQSLTSEHADVSVPLKQLDTDIRMPSVDQLMKDKVTPGTSVSSTGCESAGVESHTSVMPKPNGAQAETCIGTPENVIADVESHYNYQQYSSNFVHSLQTPKMASTLDDFEVVSTIGTGSYGTCKKIRRKKDGKLMVWKEMDYGSMSEAEKQLLVSEVNLLRELKHRHIVRYYDRIIDRSRAIIYILMEYCQGGDLASLIVRYRKDGTFADEEFVWKILIQTTLALKECHRRKNGKAILHRDLKPANIFLDRHQNVKLGDFGLARVLHHETSFAQTYVGTPYYMSPELVNNMSYNEKSDVWALGCVLYEFCALRPPFTANNQTELNRKIRIGEFPRLPFKYSSEIDKIIRKMIKVEVSQRPSIEDILRDPVVARRYRQLEHSQEKHSNSSDSSEGVSSGNGNTGASSNRNNNAAAIITTNSNSNDQVDRVKQLEDEYRLKLKQLELKEKELDSRERSIAMREKMAEEKLKRALDLMEHYRRRSESLSSERRYSDLVSPRTTPSSTPTAEPDLDDSPHSCLSKGPRDPESPKKRVTFDFYGKENLRQKSKLTDYRTEGLAKFDIYAQHLARRPDLKDRLLSPKEKPLDLHRIGLDAKYGGRNLLFFR